MQSLKDLLHTKIKESGYLSSEAIYRICLEEGYRQSNAERRLREMSDIEPVYAKSKRGTKYISGYQFKDMISQLKIEVLPQKEFQKKLDFYFKQKEQLTEAKTSFNPPL